MLITISIIAALAAVVSPSIDGERRRLTNASLALRADIRYTQRMSVMEGIEYRLEFLGNNRYLIHCPDAVPVRRLKAVSLPDGVVCLYTAFPILEYSPRGTILANAKKQGYGPQTIKLQSGPYSQFLTVVPSSGRPKIEAMAKY